MEDEKVHCFNLVLGRSRGIFSFLFSHGVIIIVIVDDDVTIFLFTVVLLRFFFLYYQGWHYYWNFPKLHWVCESIGQKMDLADDFLSPLSKLLNNEWVDRLYFSQNGPIRRLILLIGSGRFMSLSQTIGLIEGCYLSKTAGKPLSAPSNWHMHAAALHYTTLPRFKRSGHPSSQLTHM